MDPNDTDGLSVLSELIQKVENKIKKMKDEKKPKSTNWYGVWLFIALPYLMVAFMISVFLIPFIKAYFCFRREHKEMQEN